MKSHVKELLLTTLIFAAGLACSSHYCRVAPSSGMRKDRISAVVSSDGTFLATADVFESGVAPGENWGALHAPKSWCVKRQHLAGCERFCDYSPYFIDRRLDRNGLDEDACEGIEGSTVAFHAAHGEWFQWLARSASSVPVEKTALGDENLRYVWLDSCNVLQHGPDEGWSPEKFRPERDAGDVASNVYLRWARGRRAGSRRVSPIQPKLRMVCGGSSILTVGGEQVAQIWSNYILRGLPVSDSFLLGAGVIKGQPLCISRGGKSAVESPLYQDKRFVKSRNRDGSLRTGAVHIQYPISCGVSSSLLSRLAGVLGIELPASLPGLVIPLSSADAGGTAEASVGTALENRQLPVLRIEAAPTPEWLMNAQPGEAISGPEAQEFVLDSETIVESLPSPLREWANSVPELADLQGIRVRRMSASGAILADWKGDESRRGGGRESALFGLLLAYQLAADLFSEGLLVPDLPTAVAKLEVGRPLVGEMRFDRVSVSNLGSRSPDDYASARSSYDLEFPLNLRIGVRSTSFRGIGSRLSLRLNLGADATLGQACSAALEPGPKDSSESLGGPGFNLAVPRWRIGGLEESAQWTQRTPVERQEWVRAKLQADPGVRRNVEIEDLGPSWVLPPMNCKPKGNRVVPSFRLKVVSEIFEGERDAAPARAVLVFDVPADRSIDSLQSTWICDSGAAH